MIVYKNTLVQLVIQIIGRSPKFPGKGLQELNHE